ncbi:hypothetical protein LAWI1_G008956, partial [Lachnellula willkommii]
MENTPISSNGLNGSHSAFSTFPGQETDNDSHIIHKRSHSGGVLSKLSFLRTAGDTPEREPLSPEFTPGDDRISPKKGSRAMAVAVQQQKTRRRKGSLRKAALLGRGAQRDKKDTKMYPLDTGVTSMYGHEALSPTSPEELPQATGFGLGISEATPRPSMDGFASKNPLLSPITLPMGTDDHLVTSPTATSPTLTYTSTTDEDDILSIPDRSLPISKQPSAGADSYFPPSSGSLTRRRSAQKSKSPLSI